MIQFLVDAFVDADALGNRAGVCLSETFPSDTEMQRIARDNGFSETAFISETPSGYRLRWFTPASEIDLCGHATLAAAAVLIQTGRVSNTVVFSTPAGALPVDRIGERYRLHLPAIPPRAVELTERERAILGCDPISFFAARDLFLELKNQESVAAYLPDYDKLARLDRWLGIVVTARGADGFDFVSRYFCPELLAEDAATGSSHCVLIPYYAQKLGKKRMIARQLSTRGGTLWCEAVSETQIAVSGKARLLDR